MKRRFASVLPTRRCHRLLRKNVYRTITAPPPTPPSRVPFVAFGKDTLAHLALSYAPMAFCVALIWSRMMRVNMACGAMRT